MVTISIDVNKEFVCGNDKFEYTYHVTNSESSTEPTKAMKVKFVVFVPDKVGCYCPYAYPDIQLMSSDTVPGGTDYILYLDAMDIGKTISYSIPNDFKPSAEVGYSYTNTVKLYVDNELVSEATAPTVTLVAEKRSIGGFVWIDSNKNGLYEQGEEKINGIKVEIYTGSAQLIDTAITADSPDGEAGHYKFENLENNAYLLKFTPPEGYSLTQRKATEPNGSVPFPDTGKTNLYSMGIPTEFTDEIAGIVRIEPPTITATDQTINEGESFDPMEGVTAKDYMENDITQSVTVTSNNVDTSTPGEYAVTYSVTDNLGQTSTLTISVSVSKNEMGPRTQAITDIIESVALEQSALSHILNAEGEKIQKAVASDYSTEEILKINNSVIDMVGTATKLEETLQAKLALFEKSISICDSNQKN